MRKGLAIDALQYCKRANLSKAIAIVLSISMMIAHDAIEVGKGLAVGFTLEVFSTLDLRYSVH